MNNVYTCGIRLPVTVKFLRLFIAFSIYLSFVFVAQQTQCFAVACSVERQQPLLRIVRTKCRCSRNAQANLTAQMPERISDTKRRNLFVTSTALDIHCFNVHLQRQSLSDLFRRHGELIEALADGMGDGVAGCGDDRHHHHLPQPSGR